MRTLILSLCVIGSIALPALDEPPHAAPADTLGAYVLLAWNDLGMHCMNLSHATLSVLPPYNTLQAQLVLRGSAGTLPILETRGFTLEHSIPGNTWSAGKTDFWQHAQALFGVPLPADVGLTGRGLTGVFSMQGTVFTAEGIPVTPFTDAAPTVEDPYQQALVIARDLAGVEVARSTPVIPVSTDMRCVDTGCHASEHQILDSHETVAGFDPGATPILCAGCHADPALGAPGVPEAGYFSMRMHAAHAFMDERFSGVTLCYKCHPGSTPKCLRGYMSQRWGLICQDCHGSMDHMAQSIDSGRVPWVQEPSCSGCHTARFGEPPGQLYRNSVGHGGVRCSGCHGSPHAEYASREPRDNANVVRLQGSDGPLERCSVCHGIAPVAVGPHGMTVADVGDASPGDVPWSVEVRPNPARGSCIVRVSGATVGGRLLVYDVQGRLVRLLRRDGERATFEVVWDGLDQRGLPASPGTYLIAWNDGRRRAGTRIALVR